MNVEIVAKTTYHIKCNDCGTLTTHVYESEQAGRDARNVHFHKHQLWERTAEYIVANEMPIYDDAQPGESIDKVAKRAVESGAPFFLFNDAVHPSLGWVVSNPMSRKKDVTFARNVANSQAGVSES